MSAPSGGNRASRRAASRPGPTRGTTAADRYGRNATIRRGLLPGVLGAGALLVGVLAIATSWYVLVDYVVAILAAVVGVFAVQARAWWWIVPLAAVVVWWNPVVPLDLPGAVRFFSHPVGAVLLFAAGATIREPRRD